jgi:hypothetical protein
LACEEPARSAGEAAARSVWSGRRFYSGHASFGATNERERGCQLKLPVLAKLPIAASLAISVWLAQAAELPTDVETFSQKRDVCDHFRGEDSDNPARMKEIAAALQKYCKGSDKALSDLKKKYKADESVLKYLTKYEERIE